MAVIEFESVLIREEDDPLFVEGGVVTTELLTQLPSLISDAWSTPEQRFEVARVRKIRPSEQAVHFCVKGEFVSIP